MAATVVTARGKGALLLDSHPGGCRRTVEEAAAETWDGPTPGRAPRVLIIGCSAGYGSALTAAGIAGPGVTGMGLALERPGNARRTASPGWYRVAATADLARERGTAFEFVNGDCFSAGTKAAVLDRFAERFGQIDHLVYSVAAPRRTDHDGATFASVIKPRGEAHGTYLMDFDAERPALRRVEIAPATGDEIAATTKVMGGEDWALWVAEAASRGLLAEGASTVALSYLGSELTAPIYRHGTIGAAKDDLEATAARLTASALAGVGGRAVVSVNGAAVTQASTAIPGIGLYVSLLRGVLGEGMQSPARQASRMWAHLLGGAELATDELGRIRVDDWEFAPGVQDAVRAAWDGAVTAGEVPAAEAAWFLDQVHRLYGFAVDGVDYALPVETDVAWPEA
ncbi:enoyl-[acyl-carrier-protein] reductase [NADH] [Actinorhabdospora filicis]|uniref:trans-2-enoyl-CoA reductase (NAD(+)) n=1 Tax=Actinorhabdospora filicis TaxID=1785913 RepID=A0A9W6SL85_9ACTN|nr:hypothetical protein [Actinorhabdospora filicis]GLZ77821.1 enoyl-[acyl-carrier-protein] reductase [NADH] [Actinorhabdospora filicis]